MSEEKKCCGCCNNKELNNEQLDKVSGGSGWVNGKYICPNPYKGGKLCWQVKTVDGISNVCNCTKRYNGICCKEYKDNCTCVFWDKKNHVCNGEFE